MLKISLGALLCASLAMPAISQETTQPAPKIAADSAIVAPSLAPAPIIAVQRTMVTGNTAMLPANTEVVLVPTQEVNSKRIKEGQKFEMSVARDVMLGDYIVIPRGTRAWGKISYRTGKGAFGKSGKMEFDCTDVELAGRMISVSGHYRVEGQGNTGATVGTVVAVGVFAAFVTGHSAAIGQNTEWKAYTREALQVAVAAPTAPAAAPAISPASVAAPSVAPAGVHTKSTT
jgi:hypothetical protein